MKVSVAMCTYNGARYLQEQLDSLACQTHLPFELIVCDDCSTDKTMEIVSRFSETAPFPVRLTQNQKNLGSTANFDQAITVCKGELIALCDQDDVWNPEKIKKQVRAFEQDPAVGGVFCDGELIDSNSRSLNKSLWDSVDFASSMRRQVKAGDAGTAMMRHNFVTGAALMFKVALRSDFLPIPREWVHDEWIAWTILLHSRLYLLPERLIDYRIHPDQQIGADLQSLRERIGREKAHIIDQLTLELIRLKSLEERMRGDQVPDTTRYINRVQRKRAFLKARIALLQNNLLLRIIRLAPWARDYMHFANGFRSIVGDLLL